MQTPGHADSLSASLVNDLSSPTACVYTLRKLVQLLIILTKKQCVHQEGDKEKEADQEVQGPAPRVPINLSRDTLPLT